MNPHCVDLVEAAKPPRVSAELFAIPIDGEFLVYAPLRQAAFLANADFVNLIADLQDGQFDNCDLTMRDLHLIEQSLVKSLCAMYHGRIAYPKTETASKNKNKEAEKSV